MSDKEKRIAELEDRNSESAKEILLNESVVYEAEIENLDTDLIVQTQNSEIPSRHLIMK